MLGTLKARLAGAGGNGRLAALGAGGARVAVPLLVATAAITALVLAFLWRDQSSYKPVFGARENVDVPSVLSLLDDERIGYRLHPDSGQVLVDGGEVGRARMLLAAKGVVAKLPEGLELLDRNDPLGSSQFVQDIRFRRGLEGELVKSIVTLDAVQGARVHLSMPRSSSFVVNTAEKASASVVLTLKPGRTPSHEQIAAIVNMVAGSVAGLDPTRVTLTDQAGNFLSARVDLAEGFQPGGNGDAGKRYSDEARRNAQELLASIVGEGNYRVSATAEVRNERVEETRERYEGDPRVLNEATRDESERRGAALGVPGSLSNRPIDVPGADPAGKPADPKAGADGKAAEPAKADRPANSRSAVSRSYAYDRSVTQVKRGKGQLDRLSVAVVLNDRVAPGKDGRWSEAEIARIDKLLRGGLGIDARRGDQLVVSSAAFPAVPADAPWWQQPHNILEMVSTALWAIGGLAALLVLRSLGSKWLAGRGSAPRAPAASARVTALQSDAATARPGVTLSGQAQPALGAAASAAALPGAAAGGDSPMVPLLEGVDLPPVGSGVDVMVDHLRVLSAKEPERVAEVVKQWVQKQGQPDAAAS